MSDDHRVVVGLMLLFLTFHTGPARLSLSKIVRQLCRASALGQRITYRGQDAVPLHSDQVKWTAKPTERTSKGPKLASMNQSNSSEGEHRPNVISLSPGKICHINGRWQSELTVKAARVPANR